MTMRSRHQPCCKEISAVFTLKAQGKLYDHHATSLLDLLKGNKNSHIALRIITGASAMEPSPGLYCTLLVLSTTLLLAQEK